jgi:multidrug efflux system outer membrane protein
MKFKRIVRALMGVGLATGLVACASNVSMLPMQKPEAKSKALEVVVPDGVQTTSVNNVQDEQWWLLINDSTLNSLVEVALKHNADVRLAAERLNEAGAVLGYTSSDKYPSIFGQMTGNRARASALTSSSTGVSESVRLGVGMSWELDIWGKVAAQEDAARAGFLQQGYNLRAVRLSVSATVVSLYNQVRSLGLQTKVLEQTLASRNEAYKLAKQRYDVGLVNELQLRQTESEQQAVRAQLPDTREQLSKTLNALAVLVGQDFPDLPSLDIQQLQLSRLFVLPDGVSSDLLLRRPDLAASEQQLKAAEANLEVARKAFFPSIGLSAFGGRESTSLNNLFSGPAKVWSFQADVTQSIFNAGKLSNQRDAQVARRNQAVVQYEQSIRTAFQEVYDAIVAQREARERLSARQQQVETLKEVLRLAELRLANGVANQLDVLDAQRNLLSAQLSWVGAWQQQQDATVSIIRALGGGFKAS